MFICKEDQHEWRHKEIATVIMNNGTKKEGVGIKRCCVCWISKIYDMETEKLKKWDQKEAKEKFKE